jgi:uncharacterized protein with FMN-binding domain
MVTPEPTSRRIVLAGAGTAAGLALLFAYPTSLNRSAAPAHSPGAGASGGTGATGGTGTGGTGTGGTGTGGTGSTAGTSGGTSGGRFTGDAVDTRWGPVQVEITVEGGKVVSARTVQVPANNSRDVEINDYAVPVLNQEAVQAGTADIDAVSGATVTSEGYISSLQSALDKAHL